MSIAWQVRNGDPIPDYRGVPVNESAVRQLAQSDPVPNMASRWGAATARARDAVDNLTLCLRELDKVQEQLRERGMTVDVDLGPIGNAAAAARRDLERDTGRTFELPRHDRG